MTSSPAKVKEGSGPPHGFSLGECQMIKTRTYLIFDNSIKRIGLRSKKKFKEAASKIIPCLAVYFEENEGIKRIFRLKIYNYAFNEEGIRIPNIIDRKYAIEQYNRWLLGKTDDDAVIPLLPRKIRLTEIQKNLISELLKKEFGKSWEIFKPEAKIKFWASGDSEALGL